MDTQLRRKDTTRGPPLRVLSLDGGGVRGYSMLILLQELMYRSYVETEGRAPKRHEIPKPCEYFDLIAGTGTGGLIAIMLGRLRLDIETCMDVYVRMTRRVFETDKTIAGVPYRSTLFKASKLEEAIKECVREHTIFEDEGNDGTAAGGRELPVSPSSAITASTGVPKRSLSIRSTSTLGVNSPINARDSVHGMLGWGNANALLYDDRENRTKTAVTAVFKGTPVKTGSSVLLRSYDSRKEPPPEFNCTIWQAGRATSATGLAFKPIQIGQSVFLDEGAGKYNPSPQILDEAVVNEWPGRELGVLVSIGTGKRPGGTSHQQHEWWEGFVGGSMGAFAEARRRLIAKIEGCEDIHQYMQKEHLAKRGVPQENYCRLNVEVGVGEFGMNEWHRLSDISTSTRRYLSKPDVQKIVYDAAVKIARIQRAKKRLEVHNGTQNYDLPVRGAPPPPSNLAAVELPGEDLPPRTPPQPRGPQYPANPPHPYVSRADTQDKFMVVSSDEYPQSSSPGQIAPPRRSGDYRPVSEHGLSNTSQQSSLAPSPRRSTDVLAPSSPPPLPPKTPIQYPDGPYQKHSPPVPRQDGKIPLPYPDTDDPPPIVNKLRKPEYTAR